MKLKKITSKTVATFDIAYQETIINILKYIVHHIVGIIIVFSILWVIITLHNNFNNISLKQNDIEKEKNVNLSSPITPS